MPSLFSLKNAVSRLSWRWSTWATLSRSVSVGRTFSWKLSCLVRIKRIPEVGCVCGRREWVGISALDGPSFKVSFHLLLLGDWINQASWLRVRNSTQTSLGQKWIKKKLLKYSWYTILLIATVQWSDSVLYIYIYIFIFLSIMVNHGTFNIVPYAIE